MTAELDPYFVSRARAFLRYAGGDPDTAAPLAQWAQAAHEAGDRRVGVVVARDGSLVTTTRWHDGGVGSPSAWYTTGGQEVGMVLGTDRAHATFPEVCQGTARSEAEWLAAQCAEHVGVQPRTWRAYVSRGQAPAPVRHVGRTPLWDAAVVMAWQVSRRGQGWRAGQ